MRIPLALLLPASAAAMCLSPRNTAQCPALMNAFSQSAGFSFYQNAMCFNFCNGQFQNTNTFFFGRYDCVSGCKLSDITSGPLVASSSVSNPAVEGTGSAEGTSTPVRWWYPSSQTPPLVVNPPEDPATAATQVVPNPNAGTATVTIVSGSGPIVGQTASSSVTYTNPQIGRGSIASATVTGSAGTTTSQITGAGKAVPWASSTNIASAQIGRTSICTGGKGRCGKSKSRTGFSSVQNFEALASSSPHKKSLVAAATTSVALLYGVL